MISDMGGLDEEDLVSKVRDTIMKTFTAYTTGMSAIIVLG